VAINKSESDVQREQEYRMEARENITEGEERAHVSLKIGEFPVRARFRNLLQSSDRQNLASFYIHVMSNVAADLVRQI